MRSKKESGCGISLIQVAVFRPSSSRCFIAFDNVPNTWATLSAYIVTSTRQETTESRTKPVAFPSGVFTSMNKQAGSFAIVRFFVTSATTMVLMAPM